MYFVNAADIPCSDLHIAKISEKIVNWEELAPYFGILSEDEAEIRNDNPHQYHIQKRKMLWKWKQRLRNKATYSKLKECFTFAGNQLLANEVDELLHDPYSQSPHSAMATFKQYLKDCYTVDSQPSSQKHEWPQLGNTKFVQPRLTLKPTNIQNGGQEREVALSNIISFSKQENKSVNILLEGVAGSGKTTISWHACQQWAKGNMFQEFEFVIHLSLADPDIQSAASFEDLIPHPSAEVRKTVGKAIIEERGKKCLFVMDGWEDLAPTVQTSSFLRSIIQRNAPGVSLPLCSFLVTSRPVASSSLVSCISSTISVEAFSTNDVTSYTTQYFSSLKQSQKFLSSIKARPSAYSLCSLPINLVTMIFIFMNCNLVLPSLPSTQTELFESLVLVLLLRHLRTKLGYPELTYLPSFFHLPDPHKPAFKSLCQLAHFASFNYQSKSRVTFSLTQLQEANIPTPEDTFGLLKVTKRLTLRGYAPCYSFLHSAVQDFLCALWMSETNEDEQHHDISCIMNNDPMSPTLQFFAGCTQLKGKYLKTLKLLLTLVNKPVDGMQPMTSLSLNPHKKADPRRVLLAVLHCIYESHQEGLFVQVKPTNLEGDTCCFVLDNYRLSPFNCAVIGKYVSSLLHVAQFTTGTITLMFKMVYCKIGDYGLEQFLQPIFFTMRSLARTTTESISSIELHLFLVDNHLTHKSVEKVKNLLILQNNPITWLDLSVNFRHSMTNRYVVLKYFIECLSHKNCSLPVLSVGFCGFTEQHMYHLVLLLVHSHSLEHLYLSCNSLSTGFALFCSGLKMNKCLTSLGLMGVTLSDDDILLLADALHQHSKLSSLSLKDSNSFQPPIFLQFLWKVFRASSRSCLSVVEAGNRQYYRAMEQLKSFQASRRRNGLPQIHLMIYNQDANWLPAVMVEMKATKNVEKSLLTGK